eukprot:646396-Amphidinium_carterae.1
MKQWPASAHETDYGWIRTGLPGSVNLVRALGLPAHIKARIVKSLHSVGLYGAEVGGVCKE